MKKILFLFLVTFSFSANSAFYAEKCGASCSTVVNTLHYCYVNNVLVDPDAGKNCRYRGGISGNYYACCSGNNWSLFDTDSDGTLNGVDSDPYDPDIPNGPDDPIDDNGSCTSDTKTLKFSIIDTDLNGQAYYAHGNDICYYEILSETPIANSNCKIFDLQGTGISVDTSTPSGGASCTCDSGYSEQGESCVLDSVDFLNPTISFPDSVDDVHYKIVSCNTSHIQVKETHTNFKSGYDPCPDGTFDPDEHYTFNEMFNIANSDQIKSYANKRLKASFNSDTSIGAMTNFHNIAWGLTGTRLAAFVVIEKDGANQYPRVMECNQFNGIFETETGFVGTWDDAANNKFCPGWLTFNTVDIDEEEDPDPDPDPGTDPPPTGACNPDASNYASCIGINPRLDDIKEILEEKNNDDLIAAIEAIDFSSGSGSDPGNSTDMTNVENTLNSINDKLSQTGSTPDHTSTDSGFTTFAAVNANFVNGIAGTDLVLSFSNIANIVDYDETSCPALTIDLTAVIGKTLSTTVHCDVFEENAHILSNVLLIVYAFAGFRIFASS